MEIPSGNYTKELSSPPHPVIEKCSFNFGDVEDIDYFRKIADTLLAGHIVNRTMSRVGGDSYLPKDLPPHSSKYVFHNGVTKNNVRKATALPRHLIFGSKK